jgi:hypothetical protein
MINVLKESMMDRKEQVKQIDAQIADILRIAGVKRYWEIKDNNQAKQVKDLMNQKYLLTAPRVKDLIESLQKYDPEAIVFISEKFGQGAAQYRILTGFTDDHMASISDNANERYKYPVVEVSCDL